MAFYNKKYQFYLEMDVLDVDLGSSLLEVRDRMQFPRNEAPNNAAIWSIAFASKSLTSTETWYSNNEREALGILCGLEKFHYYCFNP